MSKATILDRLAGAMKTLGKREGKALTPRQRVAAAQRFNSLADIYAKELGRIESKDHKEFLRTLKDNEQLGLVSEPWLRNIDIDAIPDAELAAGADVDINDNPFLSDNIDKYQEQSEFLDWCRYNHVRPSGQALKHFRTEKIYDEVESGNLGGGDAVFQVFNAAGGFSPETGYEALDGLHSRMNAGDIGVLDAMDEAYLRGLRVARKRRGW